MMDESLIKEVARQLRRPEGDFGRQVGQNMNRGNQVVNLQTIEAMGLRRGMKVLEIGMGNGFFVSDILNMAPDIQYVGCDYSPTMVEESRSMNPTHLLSGVATFHEATADKLPLPDAWADRVMTVNTVYFWDEPAPVFAELRRVMKPEAHVAVGIRSRDTMETMPFVKHGFRLFNRDELVDYLDKHGFTTLAIREGKEPEYYRDGELVAMDYVVVVAKIKR